MLSSRTRDYRTAARRAAAPLTGAAGIELQPVPPGPAAAYLTRAPADPARWAPVTAHLGSASPVGQALRTPQMLYLARTIHTPRVGEHGESARPDPAHLCDTERFPDAHALEQHLLRSFIPAAYRPDPHAPAPAFTAQRAHHTLTFLAEHLARTTPASPDIAWWQLPEALPRRPSVLVRWAATATINALRVTAPAGLTAALAYSLVRAARDGTWSQTPRALTAAGVGVITASLSCAATATARLAARKPPDSRGWMSGLAPLSTVRWHWDSAAIALAVTCAAVGATAVTVMLTGPLGVTLAAPLGVTAVIWGGMRSDSADPSTASTPSDLLERERTTVLRNGTILATLGAVVTAALYAWRVRSGATYGAAILTGATAGTLVGVFAGLLGRLSELATWSFTTTRHYLAAHHHLPRDLMGFLADAHQHRGVLRQIGGVYQFRHLDLQHALTTAGPPGRHVTTPPPAREPTHHPPIDPAD